MKATSFETLIADQIFKISKSDKDIADYLIDCGGPFNSKDHENDLYNRNINNN